MSVHRDLNGVQIHVPYAWSFANATARSVATDFVSSDIGKLARQLDDNSLWMLVSTTPTWSAVSSPTPSSDINIDGGYASSVYTFPQIIDGGGASSTYTSAQNINAGGA